MKLYIYNLFYELLQLISLKSFLYFRGALAPKGIPLLLLHNEPPVHLIVVNHLELQQHGDIDIPITHKLKA